MSKTVVITGGFDPIHSGHISHIRKAAELGDVLIVILATDEQLIKKKGFRLLPYRDREEVLLSIRYVDQVVRNIDLDTSSAMTLKAIKPNIFAKGGDRTPGNIPKSEVTACKDIGCQIVYGVGDLLGSSTDYVRDVIEEMVRRA